MIRFPLLFCASPSDHAHAVLCRLQCSSGSAFWYLSSNCASSEPSGTRCSVFFSASCFSSSCSLLLVTSVSLYSLSLLSSCSIASSSSSISPSSTTAPGTRGSSSTLPTSQLCPSPLV